MARRWSEVSGDPRFQALPPEEQEAARVQYFNTVVAPQVPAEDLELAARQFDEYSMPKPDYAEPVVQDEVPPPSMFLDGAQPQTSQPVTRGISAPPPPEPVPLGQSLVDNAVMRPSADYGGNIDLDNRPQVHNQDGSVSTISSASFNIDGKEVLLPTISPDGRRLSEQETVEQYKQTGQHLGIFDTPEQATAAAKALSQRQADAGYSGTGQPQQKPPRPSTLAKEAAINTLKEQAGVPVEEVFTDSNEKYAGYYGGTKAADDRSMPDRLSGASQSQADYDEARAGQEALLGKFDQPVAENDSDPRHAQWDKQIEVQKRSSELNDRYKKLTPPDGALKNQIDSAAKEIDDLNKELEKDRANINTAEQEKAFNERVKSLNAKAAALQKQSHAYNQGVSLYETERKAIEREANELAAASNTAEMSASEPDFLDRYAHIRPVGFLRDLRNSYGLSNYAAEREEYVATKQGADKNYDKGFVNRSAEAAVHGWETMATSLELGRFALGSGDVDQLAMRIAKQEAERKAREKQKTPGQRSFEAATAATSAESGAGRVVGAVARQVEDFFSHPSDAAVLAAEQTPNMAPAAGLAAVGAGGGAAVGATVGGVGAVPGAIVGAKTGMAIGTVAVEFGAKIQEAVVGKLTSEMKPITPANVKAVLEDEAFIQEAAIAGAKKGITIAVMDQLFLKLGGKVASAPTRKASADAYKKSATDVLAKGGTAEAAQKAGIVAMKEAKAGVVARTAAGTGGFLIDTVGEGAGEAAGQYASGDDVDVGEAVIESLASGVTSSVETGLSATAEGAKQTYKATKGALPTKDAASAAPITPNLPPEAASQGTESQEKGAGFQDALTQITKTEDGFVTPSGMEFDSIEDFREAWEAGDGAFRDALMSEVTDETQTEETAEAEEVLSDPGFDPNVESPGWGSSLMKARKIATKLGVPVRTEDGGSIPREQLVADIQAKMQADKDALDGRRNTDVRGTTTPSVEAGGNDGSGGQVTDDSARQDATGTSDTLPGQPDGGDATAAPVGVGDSESTAGVEPDLSGVPLSLISEFPDFNLTSEGAIALHNLSPEEQDALRKAGVAETYTTKDGETYEGVHTEYLWQERERRQSERRASAAPKTETTKDTNAQETTSEATPNQNTDTVSQDESGVSDQEGTAQGQGQGAIDSGSGEQDGAVEAAKSDEAGIPDLPVVEAPLADLKLSEDVPQFKKDANTKGVVKPLGGKFDRRGVGPIQIWERLDGSREVISGRHRLDLAQRSDEVSIPAQIHREADGFTKEMAMTLDAELNIRDEQGSVADHVQYYKDSGITQQEADERGLLARSKGKTGWRIAMEGSEALVAAHRADVIGDKAAAEIASAAPNNKALQEVGIKAVQDGKSAEMAANMVRAAKALGADKGVASDQGDIFGDDQSALREVEEMASKANAKQRSIRDQVRSVKGAAKNPKQAAKLGVDVKDPDGLNKRIESLEAEAKAWDNWHTNPNLIAQLRGDTAQEARGEAQGELVGDDAAQTNQQPLEAADQADNFQLSTQTKTDEVIEDEAKRDVESRQTDAFGGQAKAAYTLPDGSVNANWRGQATAEFKPDARQQMVMDEVGKALDDGLTYTQDIYERVSKALNIPKDLLNKNVEKVERGDVGMDIYYASRAVEARRNREANQKLSDGMKLTVGEKLGNLKDQEGKRVTGVEVIGKEGDRYRLRGKRGKATYEYVAAPSVIAKMMDRAKQKGWRNDDSEQFIETKLKAKPTDRRYSRGSATLNDIGLYSAVEKAVLEMPLPEWKKEDGLASGNAIWAKLSKTAGVKKEELEWLGIEQFLKSGDKFNREDVAEYVRNNGVQIEEVVADQESSGSELSWDNGTVWDDSDAWQYEVEYMLSEFDNGSSDANNIDIDGFMDEWMRNHLDDVIANYTVSLPEDQVAELEALGDEVDSGEYYDAVIEWLQENADADPATEMRQAARDEFEEVAEAAAEEAYMDNPIYIYEASDDTNLFIFGNDDQGYDIREGGWELHQNSIGRDPTYSLSEAQIQAEDYARENGLVSDESDTSVAKWSEHIMDGHATNYRELKLTLPEVAGDFYEEAHFPDRNVVAFLRVDDRELGVSKTTEREVPINYRITKTDDGFGVRGFRNGESGEVIQLADGFETREAAEKHITDNLPLTRTVTETKQSNTYFIDEFQSDWHSRGRKDGYSTGAVDAGILDDKALEIWTELQEKLSSVYNESGLASSEITAQEFNNIAADLARKDWANPYKDRPPQYDVTSEKYDVVLKLINKSELDKDALTVAAKEQDRFERAANAERYGVADAPFKGDAWLTLGLKRALIDAVENGYGAIAWPNAEVLKERWSSRYDYTPQYNQKMPSIIKKLTKRKPEHLSLDGEPVVHEELGYWIVEIDDALREQIKREGFSLFTRTQAQPTTPKSTPEALRAELEKELGKGHVRLLMDRGLLRIEKRDANDPTAQGKYESAGDSFVVTVYSDTNSVDEIVGTILHEIASHGTLDPKNKPTVQDMLGDQYGSLVERYHALKDSSVEADRNLYEMAERRAKAEMAARKRDGLPVNDGILNSERLAHFIQIAHDAKPLKSRSLARKIIAQIKAWFASLNLPKQFKPLQKRIIETFTPDDFVSLARRAIDWQVKQQRQAQAQELQPVYESIAAYSRDDNGEPTAAELAEAKRQYDAVVQQYKGTDGWMKAPNGKPTKLNENQWIQTRTENFKNWFGDSKAVDDNGDPLVVYHGTGIDIEVFNTDGGTGKTFDTGAFFSLPVETANTYARGYQENIIPVFLRTNNPAVIDAERKSWNMLDKDVHITMGTEESTLGELFPNDFSDDVEFASTDDMARWARQSEHDGLIIENVRDHGPAGRYSTEKSHDPGMIFVVYDPASIKSAIGNAGTFNPADPRIQYSGPAPTFYSALLNAVDGMNQPKAGAQQWLATIKKQPGVKQEEIEWLGLEEWMAEQDGAITKEALQEFIAANQVHIEEVTKESKDTSDVELWWNDESGANEETPWSELSAQDRADAEQRYQDEVVDYEEDGVKFAKFTLPGGENYRELLLTLPEKVAITESDISYEAIGDRYVATYKNPNGGSSNAMGDTKAEALDALMQSSGIPKEDSFKSTHYDEPNILAHVRFNERTDADGKRVLFIEEIQSDFGQAYRKQKAAVGSAVKSDLDGIIARMKKDGVLEVNCD